MSDVDFHKHFSTFCTREGLRVDPRILDVDNRRVELHRLHQEVYVAGGHDAVSSLR